MHYCTDILWNTPVVSHRDVSLGLVSTVSKNVSFSSRIFQDSLGLALVLSNNLNETHWRGRKGNAMTYPMVRGHYNETIRAGPQSRSRLEFLKTISVSIVNLRLSGRYRTNTGPILQISIKVGRSAPISIDIGVVRYFDIQCYCWNSRNMLHFNMLYV